MINYAQLRVFREIYMTTASQNEETLGNRTFQRDAINLLISFPGEFETLQQKEQAVAKICNKKTQSVINFFLGRYEMHIDILENSANVIEFARA